MAIALALDSEAVSQSAGLADEIARLAAQIDSTTHRLLTCIRRFDEVEEWRQQGAQSCAHWLAWRIGLDLVTARDRVRVARALGQLPAIDGALARGRLSYAKTRALTRVATPDNEERLLEIAVETTGEQLERVCRRFRGALREIDELDVEDDRRSVKVRPLGDGLIRLELTLHADEADLVLKAIEKARDELRAAESLGPRSRHDSAESRLTTGGEKPKRAPLPGRADGIVHIAEGFLAAGPQQDAHGRGAVGHGTAGRYQVFVHLDQSLLASDGTMDAFLDDGARMTAEAFRRIACDAAMVGVSGAGDGGVLDIGRRSRVIPRAIRRALWVRDRGCRFPGCTNRRFVHAHHIRHWFHGGSTSLANLVTLCTFHHRLLHEGGFSVEREADGDLRFSDRFCKRVVDAPASIVGEIDPVADANDDLDLSLCGWDGERIDYDAVVDALIIADRADAAGCGDR